MGDVIHLPTAARESAPRPAGPISIAPRVTPIGVGSRVVVLAGHYHRMVGTVERFGGSTFADVRLDGLPTIRVIQLSLLAALDGGDAA